VDLELEVIGQALEVVHHLLEHLGHRGAICRHEPSANNDSEQIRGATHATRGFSPILEARVRC
jgi:hypothetical protein